jgi:preprotein translocase SecE subunit
MPANQRYVLVALLALWSLSCAVLAHAASWGLSQAGLPDAPLLGLAELSTSSAIGGGVATLGTLLLWRVGPARAWLGEVIDELLRVSWPSREETSHATVVVVISVVVCALFLGVFDAAWLWVSSSIMGLSGATG